MSVARIVDLDALEAAGFVVVPVKPTKAMELAGGKAHCDQIGCAHEFENCAHCHGNYVIWNGKIDHGDGCVNGSVAAYKAMLGARPNK